MTPTAFENFYRTQFGPVVAFLIRFGADPAEAEDAVQSAMMSLLLHPRRIDKPAAWIRVVARNNWLRAMRLRAAAVPAGVSHERLEPPPDHAGPAGDPARHHAEQDVARRAIRSLPPSQREILALVFDGYRPLEIARIIGKRPEAVRSNLALARRSLSQLLIDG
ncbi:sigma-70 family RNA polymerase sigma factor [Dactylosporangium sucinum]|nr:sigma-70 family RNA polymerase sigma factor [Dactylosporangium sucinum]